MFHSHRMVYLHLQTILGKYLEMIFQQVIIHSLILVQVLVFIPQFNSILLVAIPLPIQLQEIAELQAQTPLQFH